MPLSAARCAILLFSLLPSLVRAVSLSDFTPRVENLSNQCDAVYNRQIKDCDASDLQTGDNCSVACISGLLAIAQQVKSACTSDDVAETSIIGVFLLGKGPQTLCSNIAATTLGGGQTSTTSTTSIPEQSSTLELSSQTTDAGTTIVAGTSTTAQATSTASTTSASASEETTTAQTTTAQTTAAQTTAAATTAAVATTDDTTTATSSSSTTAAATTSSRATDLASLNEGSGGGSPFDFVAGNGSAPVTAPTRFLVVTLGLCALFFRSFS
ncbi:hypothetical protein MPH_02006 [Macrophomina phaseolina MS6]|uniref:Extracellular membrane protein CFEM domain-containing protein n=2 Tax=Macrophomina phaseolina TaxID=35725 RepID=K2RDQ1_MACPH|nr:hypothetical protein MPH_02006 [Macrophomina phaseolina MS6]KAH7038489.1 hypothetical protein B0J12DRAFT_255136 [Macrophomina phaseolina]